MAHGLRNRDREQRPEAGWIGQQDRTSLSLPDPLRIAQMNNHDVLAVQAMFWIVHASGLIRDYPCTWMPLICGVGPGDRMRLAEPISCGEVRLLVQTLRFEGPLLPQGAFIISFGPLASCGLCPITG